MSAEAFLGRVMMRVAVMGLLGLVACQVSLEVGSSPLPNDTSGDARVGRDGNSGSDAADIEDAGIDDQGEIDGANVQDAMGSDLGPPPDSGDSGVGATFQGSFVITNEIDRRMIAPYSEITGDLAIHAPGMIEVALPNLARVGGNLLVDNNPDLVRFLAPALGEIGGDLEVYEDPLLEGVDLPALTRIGEDLRVGTSGLMVRTNRKLTRIDGPRLAEVGGEIRINMNGVSPAVDPNVADGLIDIALPALGTVGYGIEIQDNLKLVDFDLSALANVDQRICMGPLGSCLKIHDVTITANFSLPECRVEALFTQLRARGYGGAVYTGNNDDDGICN